MSKDDIIIICLSGRGDKDVAAMAKYRGWIFMSKIKDAFTKGRHSSHSLVLVDHGIENTERYIRVDGESRCRHGRNPVFRSPIQQRKAQVIQEASTRALSTGVKSTISSIWRAVCVQVKRQ